MYILVLLKFTPLEFETSDALSDDGIIATALKFTPLEFETKMSKSVKEVIAKVKIYSVGV